MPTKSQLDLQHLSRHRDALEILEQLIAWLRPAHAEKPNAIDHKVDWLADAMTNNPDRATQIRETLHTCFLDLRFLQLYNDVGILSRKGFASEFWRRTYDRLMPNAPVVFSAKNLLAHVFHDPNDLDWIKDVSDQTWIKLYNLLITDPQVRLHLELEALYALEMLSIWLAAEEMDRELIRLDPNILNHDSNLIAQEREIHRFIAGRRRALANPTESPDIDAAHAWVMLDQCEQQIIKFRNLSVIKGSDLQLTYMLERLEQMLARVRDLLGIFDAQDTEQQHTRTLRLFRQLITDVQQERSVIGLVRRSSRLLAKSITNHASRKGEKYITESRREFVKMFGRGIGAGVLIAWMALAKITIDGLDLSHGLEALAISLNYGLGFVIIHILHFTVATKQPAMTAAYLAEKLERAKNGAAEGRELVRLVIQVGRSQFAAIAGNVAAALPTALIVSNVLDLDLIHASKATALMTAQHPLTSLALFYAAIAGFWLFISGLIAGYFDNRCTYLDIPGRLRQHFVARSLLPKRWRHGFANYIGNHYGALWGNLFFGFALGMTSYAGYLLALPIDIRHVAFSVANVGYASASNWPGHDVFWLYVGFAILIGLVNLTVSFFLALNVAARARGIRLGNVIGIIREFWREASIHPLELFIPPASPPEKEDDTPRGKQK